MYCEQLSPAESQICWFPKPQIGNPRACHFSNRTSQSVLANKRELLRFPCTSGSTTPRRVNLRLEHWLLNSGLLYSEFKLWSSSAGKVLELDQNEIGCWILDNWMLCINFVNNEFDACRRNIYRFSDFNKKTSAFAYPDDRVNFGKFLHITS